MSVPNSSQNAIEYLPCVVTSPGAAEQSWVVGPAMTQRTLLWPPTQSLTTHTHLTLPGEKQVRMKTKRLNTQAKDYEHPPKDN